MVDREEDRKPVVRRVRLREHLGPGTDPGVLSPFSYILPRLSSLRLLALILVFPRPPSSSFILVFQPREVVGLQDIGVRCHGHGVVLVAGIGGVDDHGPVHLGLQMWPMVSMPSILGIRMSRMMRSGSRLFAVEQQGECLPAV
jgi:hypothetical protein